MQQPDFSHKGRKPILIVVGLTATEADLVSHAAPKENPGCFGVGVDVEAAELAHRNNQSLSGANWGC